MQGDRQNQNEFTIERGREKNPSGARSSSRGGASSVPPREGRASQAAFDLDGSGQRQPKSGMPDRLRRKYYVAEAGAGDEAKVYADPRGEYLAFKVSAERMATRLEDAAVVRDMVSIAQHRGWKEVELRGSEEFRRTAWIEASARGLSVRGYEPDPVDRAALAFRAKPEMRSTRTPQSPQTPEAGASETVTVDGVKTTRPIDVTVMPPESHHTRSGLARERQKTAEPRNWSAAKDTAVSVDWHDRGKSERPTATIELAALDAGTSQRPQQEQWHARADRFWAADSKQVAGDDAVKAARSQIAAIERALAKAVRDPATRQSIVDFAKERIARELEKGREFARVQVRAKQPVQSEDKSFRPVQFSQDRSNQPRSERDR
ncbi:LPD7 domain-containing protein [Bosea sp. (in: a-proteobacteria)]|uniref:LPD7 domain-containing protein n=1 Tax=Bosea sp. (in: a-proteobacteria) TaxID=1871050 RepID=UPI0027377751|nr:LPD7 domain-containing protein [Bosea sp. (in: a-proteobacteria)]MDP3257159.1 LPD7 domain-containing protein [Bosea sp. (in: a-proteobacteria)]